MLSVIVSIGVSMLGRIMTHSTFSKSVMVSIGVSMLGGIMTFINAVSDCVHRCVHVGANNDIH